MPNIISGHISGNYGGPRSCDTAYGASRSATSCASNTGDCSHTVVVGTTGLNPFASLNTIYPDNINIYKGQSYTGPTGCTAGNGCRYTTCNDAESYVKGAFYVNPGECVELLFTFYSRAYNDDTAFCRPALDLTISGATAPNLGILSGSWYGFMAANNRDCCYQINTGRICEPELYSPVPSHPSFNYHRAYLTYEMFRNDMLSYQSSFSSFCCPAYASCLAGTQSVRPIYDNIYTSCIFSYAQECYYQSRTGCIGGTGSASNTVIADIVGPYTASYIYCADQPCGARIEFTPRASSLSSIGNIQAQADFDAWLQITGSTGCGTGC